MNDFFEKYSKLNRNAVPKKFVAPMPCPNYLNERAYMDYVRDGDAFFRDGLTFDQFIEQKERMIQWSQASARTRPHFYSQRMTKFDGYRDL